MRPNSAQRSGQSCLPAVSSRGTVRCAPVVEGAAIDAAKRGRTLERVSKDMLVTRNHLPGDFGLRGTACSKRRLGIRLGTACRKPARSGHSIEARYRMGLGICSCHQQGHCISHISLLSMDQRVATYTVAPKAMMRAVNFIVEWKVRLLLIGL